MKIIKVGGKELKVTVSNRKKKKFKVEVNGKKIHFGAKGYKIAPGKKKGDRYCARSSGIKNKTNKKITPNTLSRAMWKCKGKKSLR